jgi:hypothetical protein
MGNCLGQDMDSLSQGLVPSGGMLVGAQEKAVDPDDPWKDWYYNDYDQPAMVDGRMQSGRWDMSRESFAGKLEEKQRIQQSLAQKAQLDKANAALAAQRKVAGGGQPPPKQTTSPHQQHQHRAPGGGVAGGAGTPGRPSKTGAWNSRRAPRRLALLPRTALLVLTRCLVGWDWRSGGKSWGCWWRRCRGHGPTTGAGSWQRYRAQGHALCSRCPLRG